jgi:hypothetical protein
MKTKRERFEEIAGKRVQFVIGKLDQLGKCSNRNNYEYSDEDVKKMFAAIREAIRHAEMRFKDEIKKGEITKFEF